MNNLFDLGFFWMCKRSKSVLARLVSWRCVFQQSGFWHGHRRHLRGAARGAATGGDQQGAPASHEDGSVASVVV